MPKITVPGRVSAEEAADLLREQMPRHKVTVRRGGSMGSISIGRGLSMANVHLDPAGEATEFRVHGSGILIGRIVNELGIARQVTRALGQNGR